MSPWKACPSQVSRNSPYGAAPTRAMPTFSKPSSRALLLMESALLIVVVREAARGAELVALVGGVERRAAVRRHAAVADGALPRDDPEQEVHERGRAQDPDRDVHVAGPEDPGAQDRRQDDPEPHVSVEVLLDIQVPAAAEHAAVDDVPGRNALRQRDLPPPAALDAGDL